MTIRDLWAQFKEMLQTLLGEGWKPVTSAYGYIYNEVVNRLMRDGIRVGGTSFVPRIEVHTVTEQAVQDKGNSVRTVTMTVETIHNASFEAAAIMADENVALLTSGWPIEVSSDAGVWTRIFGVTRDQRQDLTESSDTDKILYRILDTFTVWVESEPFVVTPPTPDPTPEPEPENP